MSDFPDRDRIRAALSRLTDDRQILAAAVELIAGFLTNGTDALTGPAGADVDLQRAARCGFPEVIYGEGKPADLIVEILRKQADAGQVGFVTRVTAEQAATIEKAFPGCVYNATARTVAAAAGRPDTSCGHVAVVSAGSCDAPVAQEALETLRWMKVPCRLIEDVGVAGPHRLLRHVPALQTMAAVVVVAGMEAALPSVVGGHVSCPVIGVPTSVGYGASLGGITALLSMLSSCASNVLTVNIDGGFRGGYTAGLIARACHDQGEF